MGKFPTNREWWRTASQCTWRPSSQALSNPVLTFCACRFLLMAGLLQKICCVIEDIVIVRKSLQQEKNQSSSLTSHAQIWGWQHFQRNTVRFRVLPKRSKCLHSQLCQNQTPRRISSPTFIKFLYCMVGETLRYASLGHRYPTEQDGSWNREVQGWGGNTWPTIVRPAGCVAKSCRGTFGGGLW